MPEAKQRGFDGFVVILVDMNGKATLRVCPVESEANDLARDWTKNGFSAAVVPGKYFRMD